MADGSVGLMGVIVQAVVDDQGHVLLLDSQLAHVLDIQLMQVLGIKDPPAVYLDQLAVLDHPRLAPV